MDPLALLGRTVLVFALLGVVLWAIRRSDGLKRLRRSETPLEVLGSARLGKGASIALVRIGDADYALGVTDQAVSLLTEAELPALDQQSQQPDDAPVPAAAGTDRPSFAAALQAQIGLLNRRRRRGDRDDVLDGPGPTGTAEPEPQQLATVRPAGPADVPPTPAETPLPGPAWTAAPVPAPAVVPAADSDPVPALMPVSAPLPVPVAAPLSAPAPVPAVVPDRSGSDADARTGARRARTRAVGAVRPVAEAATVPEPLRQPTADRQDGEPRQGTGARQVPRRPRPSPPDVPALPDVPGIPGGTGRRRSGARRSTGQPSPHRPGSHPTRVPGTTAEPSAA